MRSSSSASNVSLLKRKLSETATSSSDDSNEARLPKQGSSKAVRGNPASFSSTLSASVAATTAARGSEALKKSTSWPGPVTSSSSSSSSVLSPISVVAFFDEDVSYDDHILNSKFQQQSAGVTKSLHDKACELIAGAAHAYNCGKATTMLALHLFDRALALTAVRKAEITLLAATCVLIAAKLEEINPPYAEELAYYCGKRFEKEDIYNMEGVLLPLFQCQVSVPTRYDFAMRFCEQAQLTSREKSLVTLLLELSFLDYNLNYFLPSKVAAGAMHLAMQMLRHSSKQALLWPAALERLTRCGERDLVEVVQRLRLVHWGLEEGPMNAINQRYSSDEHYGLMETPALPYSQLRFDQPGLFNHRVETALPEYAECKTMGR